MRIQMQTKRKVTRMVAFTAALPPPLYEAKMTNPPVGLRIVLIQQLVNVTLAPLGSLLLLALVRARP